MLPKPLKERDERSDVDEKTLSEIEMSISFESKTKKAEKHKMHTAIFRLGPGKRWQEHKGRGPCSCSARPLSSRFGIYYKRKRESTSDNHVCARQRVEWNGRERTLKDI